MKFVDSLALGEVDKALGLAGPGAQATELDDGLINQVLEVANLVSRARTPISHGIKWAIIQNTHALAGDQVTAWDPYFRTTAPNTELNWPVPVPKGFDIWFLGATARVISGGGFSNGYLGIVGDFVGDGAYALGHAGAPTTDTIRYALQNWDSQSIIAGQTFARFDGRVWAYGQRPVRLIRDATMEWRTASTAAGTYQANIMLALVPTGLPQDAAP